MVWLWMYLKSLKEQRVYSLGTVCPLSCRIMHSQLAHNISCLSNFLAPFCKLNTYNAWQYKKFSRSFKITFFISLKLFAHCILCQMQSNLKLPNWIATLISSFKQLTETPLSSFNTSDSSRLSWWDTIKANEKQ